MKKAIIFVMMLAILGLFGCGSKMEINGKEYDTYGLLNRDAERSSCIKYKVITGNVVWGILLSETVVAPIYFFGFSMYEPVGLKGNCNEN